MNAIYELTRAREAYRKALQDAYIAIPLELKALGELVEPPTIKPPGMAPAAPRVNGKIGAADVLAALPKVKAALTAEYVSSRLLASSLSLPCPTVKAACEMLVERGEAEHKPNGAHPMFRFIQAR